MNNPPLYVGQRVALTRQMLQLGFPDIRGTVLSRVEGGNYIQAYVLVRWDTGEQHNLLERNLIAADHSESDIKGA